MEHIATPDNLFKKTDKNLWINKLKKELKLQDIDSLAHKAGQKINIDPFYTKEDLSRIRVSFFDKIFGIWKVVYKINFSDQNALKKEIEKSKKFNADHVEIWIQDTQNVDLISAIDLLTGKSFTIKTSDPNAIGVTIPENSFLHFNAGDKLINKADLIQKLASVFSQKNSHGSILGISSSFNEDPGTEIAFSIARAVEYFDLLTKKGVSKEVILSNIHFHTSIGDNFIIEIAKLRAFRSLWDKVKTLLLSDHSVYTTFHAELNPSKASVKNENDEVIANTVQFIAAALGNSDYIKLNSQTLASAPLADDFYQRIRLNIAHIIREESFMDKVTDPLAGSYLIETVTSKISEAAWEHFKTIEEAGGYSEAIRKGGLIL